MAEVSDFPAACATLINTVVGSPNLCTGTVLDASIYDYTVTLWVAATYTSLFGLVALIHAFQAIRGRKWFMLWTVVICAVTETIGWGGRTWTSVSTEWVPAYGGFWYSGLTPYLMQISTLIFAPALLAAGWYIMLGQIIGRVGPQYCRFNKKTYAIFFVAGDLFSLVLQALGGAIASAAETTEGANNGAKIMVAGVIVQMVVMSLYCILLAEVVTRYLKKRPVKPFRFRKTREAEFISEGSVSEDQVKKAKILIGANIFSTVLVFIRSIFRTIELLEGWSGPLVTNQTLFNILDAMMVLFALIVFIPANPAYLLPNIPKSDIEAGSSEKIPVRPELGETHSDTPSQASVRTLVATTGEKAK